MSDNMPMPQAILPCFEVKALEVFQYKIEGIRQMSQDMSLPHACRIAAEHELYRLRGAYVCAMIKASA
jgi:hypothetical protein